MAKSLTTLIVLVVIGASILLIYFSKDSYKLLPINENDPLVSNRSNFQNWREFGSPYGNFKVLLPSLPQHVADKIPDPLTKENRQFDMYAAADENGTAYMINTIIFPNAVDDKDVEDVLRKVINDMLERKKENKLKKANMENFRDFRSLDFAYENGDVTVAGKAFLQGKTLYVLSMVDKTGSFKNSEFDFFVNSFEAFDGSQKIPKPSSKTSKLQKK